MLHQGYFEEPIAVGEETRTAKVYIPEGSEMGSYFVVLTVPDKMNTEDFLTKSGWVEKAEKENLCLYVLEPAGGNGDWGTVDEETAYVQAAYTALGNGKYYLPFPCYYLVGYGTGGTALHKYVMTTATTIAAAAFIDASDIDDAYLASLETIQYKDVDVNCTEVPAPVWIITTNGNQPESVINYWKKANECEETAQAFALGSEMYPQKENTGNDYTPCGNVSKTVILSDATLDTLSPSFADTLYDEFFCKTTRFGSHAGGNTLALRPDYEELGVEYKTMTLDGYKREYLVYVPEALRDSQKPLPLVFTVHGANQTGKMMFDMTRWFEIADEEGFIVVAPYSTLNPATKDKVARPTWKDNYNDTTRAVNDIHFIETLIQQLDKDYNVDASRRYFGGHSNGSMMTNNVGMLLPEYFAALGSTSGPIMAEDRISKDAKTGILPVYLLMGEHDYWSWAPTEGPVNLTLNYWLNRNGLDGVEKPTSVTTEGKHTTYEWQNEDGVPLYRYTQSAQRGHSFLPGEMRMLWDWYKNYSRDTEQGILYNGTPISGTAK